MWVTCVVNYLGTSNESKVVLGGYYSRDLNVTPTTRFNRRCYMPKVAEHNCGGKIDAVSSLTVLTVYKYMPGLVPTCL
jgi:hypothetical protein